jgi:RHS repeat-associated protein
MSYDSYGNRCSTCSISSPFGFDGGYTDATSLVYLINRYYDPVTEQFLSVDPVAGATDQPYAFTSGDPVNGSDPSGLWPGEGLVHAVLDIVAVPPYAAYYGAYEVGKAINKVGCSLGSAGCVVSHALVAETPIPELESIGLTGDVAIDWIKGLTVNHESLFDEDVRGGVLPRFIDNGGPKVFLPGLSKNPCGGIHIDFEF